MNWCEMFVSRTRKVLNFIKHFEVLSRKFPTLTFVFQLNALWVDYVHIGENVRHQEKMIWLYLKFHDNGATHIHTLCIEICSLFIQLKKWSKYIFFLFFVVCMNKALFTIRYFYAGIPLIDIRQASNNS